MQVYNTTITRKRLYNFLYITVLLSGLALRIYQQFFAGRPLWEDEAHLALNFIDSGYLEMFMPLKHFQSAPILFLLGVETCSYLFGFGEIALRTFPFIISILSYPLLYFFVRDMTGSRLTALLVFIFFSFNAFVIVFASELKPYTVEASAVIVLGYLNFSKHTYISARREKLLKITGAIALFAANTSFIMLFVIACYRFLYLRQVKQYASGEEYQKTRLFNKRLFTTWGIAFAASIILNIIINPYADNMREVWKSQFIPMNIFSSEFLQFMQQHLHDIFFRYVLLLTDMQLAAYLLAALLLTGIVYMLRVKHYDWLLIVVLPVMIHLFLSWAQLYPLYERFILYLVPLMYIWMAISIVTVANVLTNKIHAFAAGVWIMAMLVFVLQTSMYKYPVIGRDVKPCLDVINRYPANMKLYVTAPKTLYEYYLKTGYVHNTTNEEVLSGLSIEQYNEQVGYRPDGYIMLYVATKDDAAAHLIRHLESQSLIRYKYEYGSYGVVIVQPRLN
ncbi:MAG: hypothetical protein H3C54_06620 [Taibaiella sp.]|nr:hypothetical protein [Taibaiella sp.]